MVKEIELRVWVYNPMFGLTAARLSLLWGVDRQGQVGCIMRLEVGGGSYPTKQCIIKSK
jgi:hypothetical protein